LTITGDVLFRWRSYMPLVLVPLFWLTSATIGLPHHSRGRRSALPCPLSGLGLRAFVIGTAPEGQEALGTEEHAQASSYFSIAPRGFFS